MTLLFVKFFCKISEPSEGDILKAKIEVAKRDMNQAASDFEHATDPCLIDSCIYELNAAQMRYKYLLQQAKRINLSESCLAKKSNLHTREKQAGKPDKHVVSPVYMAYESHS